MMDRSQKRNASALRMIIGRLNLKGGAGVRCPHCGQTWNKLTPAGMCIDCEDAKQ